MAAVMPIVHSFRSTHPPPSLWHVGAHSQCNSSGGVALWLLKAVHNNLNASSHEVSALVCLCETDVYICMTDHGNKRFILKSIDLNRTVRHSGHLQSGIDCARSFTLRT